MPEKLDHSADTRPQLVLRVDADHLAHALACLQPVWKDPSSDGNGAVHVTGAADASRVLLSCAGPYAYAQCGLALESALLDDLDFQVDAKSVANLIKQMSDLQIEITSRELILSSRSAGHEYRLRKRSPIVSPRPATDCQLELHLTPTLLTYAGSALMRCTAPQDARSVLGAVQLSRVDGVERAVATDSMRMLAVTLRSEQPDTEDGSVCVPGHAFQWARLALRSEDLPDVISVWQDDRWLELRCGSASYLCAATQGEFPAWEELMDTMSSAEATVRLEDFALSLKRLSPFAVADRMRFAIQRRGLKLEAHDAVLGRAYEYVPWTDVAQGASLRALEPAAIEFSVRRLTPILTDLPFVDISVHWPDNSTRPLFIVGRLILESEEGEPRPVGEISARYLQMPLHTASEVR